MPSMVSMPDLKSCLACSGLIMRIFSSVGRRNSSFSLPGKTKMPLEQIELRSGIVEGVSVTIKMTPLKMYSRSKMVHPV